MMRCALGWACWKTYLGRPETDGARIASMEQLGIGLSQAKHDEDALSVREAELSMKRRLGASENSILVAQGNLANTYQELGRLEEAMCLRRDVYSGDLRLHGEEHPETLIDAHNYANSLLHLKRFGELKPFLRKTMPVARRVLGEGAMVTLGMRQIYAGALYADEGATLDDLHEAVTTLEDVERIARRVFGGVHPVTKDIEGDLRKAQFVLCAREAVPK